MYSALEYALTSTVDLFVVKQKQKNNTPPDYRLVHIPHMRNVNDDWYNRGKRVFVLSLSGRALILASLEKWSRPVTLFFFFL